MLKRAIKPGDTHLMTPDEEYCRVIYERVWNTPNQFDLTVQVFDQGGTRLSKSYKKVSADEASDILQSLLGEGWETIFAQDYNDWMIRCQKRLRVSSQTFAYLSTTSGGGVGMWRNIVVGGISIGALIVLFGWIAGLIPPIPVAENPLPSTESSQGDIIASLAPEQSEPSAIATPPTEADPFVLAVRLAQEAVLDGRVADSQEEWEDLAGRWQAAAALMANVPSSDDRYEIAQDRIETYEANGEMARSQAEKF